MSFAESAYKVPAIEAALPERMAFLKKVYGLLSVSVFVAAAATWMTISNQNFLMTVAQSHFAFIIAEFAALFFVFWARKKENFGVIALLTFTLLTGITISPLVYALQHVVPEALVLTGTTFAALSFYATTTKKDFSFLGGMLTTVLIVMVVGGLLNVFLFKSTGVSFLFSAAGVLVFSGFILYDTQNILKNYPTDEYISATLTLYLDVLNLFISILRILGFMGGSDD